jgi:polysaccharide export outer membrane protein
MKAVRFITIFSFLLVFNLVSISAINAQNDTKETKADVKTTETIKEGVKPVEPATNAQLQTINSKEERYRIGLHDVIEITVYRHENLSRPSVSLDDSGMFRMPRIDKSIVAICKTELELANEITELYRESYLRDPFVTVNVKERNSQPLSVIGAVQKPGSFYTTRRLTLLELISFAGGPNVEIAGNMIQVARVGGISGCKSNENIADNDDGVAYFSFKMADVLNGKTNPIMRPGDIIVVPEADKIYVTGNVFKPTAIALKQTMTLTQAIASAGGLLPSSKKSQVRIIRQSERGSEGFIYSLNDIRDEKIADPILQANDIVEVPVDKFKQITESFIRAVSGGIGGSLPYRIIP